MKNHSEGRPFAVVLVAGALAVYFAYRISLLSTASSTASRLWQLATVSKFINDTQNRFVEKNSSEYRYMSMAANLSQRIRVLCWVMTQPANHVARCRHVKATWGRRCNVLLFISTAEDKDLPAIKVSINEGRDWLWGKTKRAFKYVYKHHRDDADWFLKADDDTYVVVENLRYMLSRYSSNRPIYFGCRYKSILKEGYMSGGAGYVLSRAALDKLVLDSLPYSMVCKENDTGAEDAELGKCLVNVGVEPMDSRDFMRRGRFFPFLPEEHIFPWKDKKFWYWDNIYYPIDEAPGVLDAPVARVLVAATADEVRSHYSMHWYHGEYGILQPPATNDTLTTGRPEGKDCCSEHAITFHYVDAAYMYVLDYLIYQKPYGIKYLASERPRLKIAPQTTPTNSTAERN